MISTVYRESLQSLDGMLNDQPIKEPQKDAAPKRVKHGPTTIIQIPEKRRKISTSVTANHVVEGKSKRKGVGCC